MKKDYIVTFLTEFIVLVSGILVYKLAADIFGKEGFSEYAMSRRAISFILPALLMGLGVGIPRYIAYASANPSSKNSDAYFNVGVLILIIVVLTFIFIFNLLKDSFAFLIFGTPSYRYLIFPMSLMLFGLVLHTACYSYFRGKLLMLRANSLQFINMGIILPFAFMIGKDVYQVILISGLLLITISIIYLIFIAKNLTFEEIAFFSHIKELLSYGIQRVPGDFGLAALLSFPAIFTAHIAGVEKAGFVAFGTSLLGMIGTAFAPIGLILLPKASQIMANNDIKLLKNYVIKILKIVLVLTATGTLVFLLFAKNITTLYLGHNFDDLIFIAKLIMVASIGYGVYVAMRSVIDAYYIKAINTVNILLSLFLLLLLSGIGVLFIKDYVYIVCCFVIALFFLGSLTLLEIRRLLLRRNNGI